jgi:5-formyltetrahydrofolate cyclo-ligase
VRCSHVVESKAQWRARLRAARAAREEAARRADGELLAETAAGLWSGVAQVAAYAAVRDEPPTRPLLDRLTAAGVRVLLPVVDGAGLSWAAYTGWEELRRSDRGLLEPAPPRSDLGAEAADVVLVPALGVDRAGHRLGRGAGYYDRALTSVPTSRLVAVVFDDELVDVLPVEPHDVDVGAALLPLGGLVHLRSD